MAQNHHFGMLQSNQMRPHFYVLVFCGMSEGYYFCSSCIQKHAITNEAQGVRP